MLLSPPDLTIATHFILVLAGETSKDEADTKRCCQALTQRSNSITPILAALNWLPTSFRIDFKIGLLIDKALNGQASAYICDLLTAYKSDRCYRSSGRAPI